MDDSDEFDFKYEEVDILQEEKKPKDEMALDVFQSLKLYKKYG